MADRQEDRMTFTMAKPAAWLTMNDRVHWRTRSGLTKVWRTAAFCSVAEQWGAPSRRRRPPAAVRVSFPVPDPGRRRDPSNWAPTVKAIVDGMVDAGVWPDDTPDQVVVLDSRFHRVARGLIGDVRVHLIPLDQLAEDLRP